jgi:hypothetical protein
LVIFSELLWNQKRLPPVKVAHYAGCPRFAPVLWALTWDH